MRSITTAIEIPAPPTAVWEVLVDPVDRDRWDPFITELSGSPVVGERLRVTIAPPGRRPMRFRPTVTAAEPGQVLEWLGHLGVRGIFDGRHRFELQPVEIDGAPGTRLVHAESFRGLLVPMLWRTLESPTLAGFEACNQALARRVADRAQDRERR